jgi:hypothetical protein
MNILLILLLFCLLLLLAAVIGTVRHVLRLQGQKNPPEVLPPASEASSEDQDRNQP